MQLTIYRISKLGWRAALVVTVAAFALISARGTSLAVAQKSLVNINTATQAELEAVKGVGPATAKKIIDNRPYKSVEDLSKAGLSAKKIDSLKSSLTTGETSAPSASAAAKEEKKGVKEAKEQKPVGAAAGKPVDLNTADQKALEDLPGVGPATAKRIIEARPFKSVDDLSKIKGMSKAKVEALRDRVTVGAAKAAVSESKPAPAASASKPAPAAEKPATAEEPVQSATSRDAEKGRAASTKLAPGEKINLNTASKEDLEKLPDIGPVKAQAIIDGRPYAKVEDVMHVKGIKEGIFGKIKDNITVR